MSEPAPHGANRLVARVQAGAGVFRRDDDLDVGPADAAARDDDAVSFDEPARLFGRRARDARQHCEVVGDRGWYTRAKLELAEDDVARDDPTLAQKANEPVSRRRRRRYA